MLPTWRRPLQARLFKCQDEILYGLGFSKEAPETVSCLSRFKRLLNQSCGITLRMTLAEWVALRIMFCAALQFALDLQFAAKLQLADLAQELVDILDANPEAAANLNGDTTPKALLLRRVVGECVAAGEKLIVFSE